MSDCARIQEVAAYVLGALDEAEVEGFATHTASCTACAQEVESLQRVVDVLPLAAPQTPAPTALKGRIMQVVESEAELLRAAGPDADRVPRAEARRRRLGWLTARPAFTSLAAAALIAVGAVGGIVAGSGSDDGDGGGTRIAAGPRATVMLRHGHAALHTAHFKTLSGGQVYQVWLQHGDRPPVPTHTAFNVRPDGHTVQDVEERVKGYDKLLVTIEPSSGQQKPTSAPIVAAHI